MRRRWPLIVLLLAPLAALWPGLTGLALGPFDAIRHLAPWNGPAPAQPWDVLMADSVLQSHVWRTMVLDAWGKGQLPLWNPYEFAGTPLLANSQSGGFYPPHIVLGLLHVPAGLAGFLLAWFHLALAGIGTHALVRRLGGSSAGGLTAGLSFVLSPFLLGWAPLSSVPSTVAWIPLALACVTDVFLPARTVLTPFESSYRARGGIRSWAALAACVGMMLLAGHLQFAAYGIGAVLFVAVLQTTLVRGGVRAEEPTPGTFVVEGDDPIPSSTVEGLRELVEKPAQGPSGAGRRLIGVLFALVLGGALAAPQFLPVLSYSKESHRRNVPTEEGYQASMGSALKPFELATLAHPMALGSPREPVQVGGQTIAAYWPPLVKNGANYAESAVSVGAVIFALLFAAPWRRRETWPFAALGGVALLLALGTPLNRLLYSLVPGWSSTGSPGRVEVLFVLAACVLAGLAVDRLGERKARIVAAVGVVVGLLFALALPNLAEAQDAAVVLRGAATAGAMPVVLLATVLALVALLAAKRTPWAVPAGAVLVAILTHAAGLVPFGKPLDPPKGDPNVRIAVVNDAWDIVTQQPAVLPPNLAALGGLHELSGYDSLTSRDAVEMLRTVNGGTDPSPPVNGNMMFVKPSVDPKALAECGVTEVWSRKPLPRLGTPETREGYVVYKIDGPGRVTGGTVVDGYDRQRVISPPNHLVTILDRWVEGWESPSPKVAVIKQHSVRTWRSVSWNGDRNPGFDVTLRYSPPGLVAGGVVGALAWLGLIGLTVAGKRRS